ncbi:MAG: glycosyltransferase [Planctomycetes bacterium]|nr:glycosyltransferase [Planctomycetota bacterium]
MELPDAPPSPSVDPGAFHLVDRVGLDAARRSPGVDATSGTWTACHLPERGFAVAADGTVRGCAFAACSLPVDDAADLLTTWRGPAFANLRQELAAGRLPTTHCAGCVRWLRRDLAASAALAAPGEAAAQDERPNLTITLPNEPGEWPAQRREQVLAAVGAARSLEIVAEDPTVHPFLRELLAAATNAEQPPAVTLRGRRFAAGDRLGVTSGVRMLVLEVDGEPDLTALAQLAATLGAKAEAHFVLKPHDWHWLEDLARDTAARAIPLALAVQQRTGDVPLAALSVEDLRFAKEVVVGLWPRLGGDAQPSSLRPQAFDRLCNELRATLLQRTEAAIAAGTQSGADQRLSLPSLDHPWFTDPQRRRSWMLTLLGQGHLPLVRDWLLETLGRPDGSKRLQQSPGLRALAQRTAWEQRSDRLLELLRALYSDGRKRSQLVHEDADFAASHDLVVFGGPWAERLGIAQDQPRKRPFSPGKRTEPSDRPPLVTVLIPSYRHGPYIEKAIQSVLAQRRVPFRVLVVDDLSPDDTVAQAKSVEDPRLEVRVNEANLGLGNSVLQALAGIDTPYVALLNSDDLFHPDRLARCCAVLDAQPHTQLVTTGMHLVDARGGELQPEVVSLILDGQKVYDWVHWYRAATPTEDLTGDALFLALLERNFLATSSNLVCRTAWLRAQAPHLQSLKYCLDWQLFLEAALDGSLHHLREPLVAYRLHATNTVWFREGRRWSYYLEVNRVAAAALRRFVEHHGHDVEERVTTVLDAVAGHVASNRETDGLALFVNAVLDAVALEKLSNTSPRVQALIETLNRAAEAARSALDAAARHERQGGQRGFDHRLLLGDLAREQIDRERSDRRWLQTYVVSLEERLRACWDGRHQLEAEKQTLLQQVQAKGQELARSNATNHEQKTHLAAAEERGRRLEADLGTLRTALRAVETLQALIDKELQSVRAERDTLRASHDRLADEWKDLQGRHGALQSEHAGLRTALADDRRDLAATRSERDALRTHNEQLEATLAGEREAHARRADAAAAELEAERTAAAASLAQRAQELTQRTHEIGRLEEQLEISRHEHAQEKDARDRLQARTDELGATLAQERTAHAAELADARDAHAAELANARDAHAAELADARRRQAEAAAAAAAEAERRQRDADELLARRDRELAHARKELETTRRSREFRAGNFLWNKMPLGYVTRRGKKWIRRLLDAKDRALMVFKRRRAEGTAIVTACWHWPIYSHTFVYQEMIGLTHMGLDVRMFHWDLGDTAQLHKAFGYLADHRTQLQPIWENHLRDKEHFEKTRPGRLRAFLERIAAVTGKPVEELEKEPLVLQGCTFARMAELAGAKYLHSYFFYDQSFMAMQAAWLLDLPRGVSCYADHMLADYPFKLVPLHVELCDVIVATSARIKRELSAMTQGRFDEKIIVKPNGVDGARFPPIQRADRKAGEPIEVVSISRIEPKKGLTHLVEAIAQLKQKGITVKAHIVGSKDPHSQGSLEYAAGFEALIAKLGVSDLVVLHGMKKQEELPPILQRCRAFVAPYVEMGSGDKDGIPTAMLEGLASGLPVVTTDSGSILEVVTHEVEGIVVPQRDSEAFARALERLVQEPATERRMAKAARERFDREFDIRVTEVRLHERVARAIQKRSKGKANKPS